MAKNNVCVICGVFGVKRDLVNCADCCAYAIHRYCMSEWPITRFGRVSWFCGCQEIEELPDQSDIIVQHDEISNHSGYCAEEDEVVSNQIQRSEQIGSEEKKVIDQKEEIKKSDTSSATSTSPAKAKAGKNKTRQQKIPTKFMKSFTSYGNLYGPEKQAEPIIRSIWSGSFELLNMHNENMVGPVSGITAFLSNKVEEKAWDETVEFGPVLRTEMVLKDLVWPNSFGETGPRDEDIAVYFFSSLGVEAQVYEYLVFEMMKGDLAMRIDLENAEILIFTSVDLIPRLRKFQGKWYLWGFFRQKHGSKDEHDSLSGPDLCSSC